MLPVVPIIRTPMPKRPTRRIGKRDRLMPPLGRVSGNERQATTVKPMIIGTANKKAPRQNSSWAKTPPIIGPIRAAVAQTPEVTAIIRVRRGPGNSSLIRATFWATIMPAPNP